MQVRLQKENLEILISNKSLLLLGCLCLYARLLYLIQTVKRHCRRSPHTEDAFFFFTYFSSFFSPFFHLPFSSPTSHKFAQSTLKIVALLRINWIFEFNFNVSRSFVQDLCKTTLVMHNQHICTRSLLRAHLFYAFLDRFSPLLQKPIPQPGRFFFRAQIRQFGAIFWRAQECISSSLSSGNHRFFRHYFAHMCVCMRMCTHVCMGMCGYMCVWIRAHMSMCMDACTYEYVYWYVHIYVCMCTYVYNFLASFKCFERRL